MPTNTEASCHCTKEGKAFTAMSQLHIFDVYRVKACFLPRTSITKGQSLCWSASADCNVQLYRLS